MSLYGTNTSYIQCNTVHEYRPARQAIRAVHVILVASNECGCVTVQELFDGRVNFLQLKHALIAALIQGREENEIRYVPESVVDMQSFGAHCMTLYAHGLLCSQKRPVGSSENRAYAKVDFNRTETEIIDSQCECGWLIQCSEIGVLCHLINE